MVNPNHLDEKSTIVYECYHFISYNYKEKYFKNLYL